LLVFSEEATLQLYCSRNRKAGD